MSKSKRLNPYQRLLEEIKDFCRELKYRHTSTLWIYPKEKLNNGWGLLELYHRAKTANDLGYQIILESVDSGLRVYYQKKIPEIPWSWK